MLSINYNPDVLSCLANLSNDEVFTPPKLVGDILDMLPQELFTNKETTFLDPVSKSGVFLREIAKRLMIGLETEIPDQQERINHIFQNQLYGIAITELTALLSRRSVYCSKNAKSKYSVCETFDTESGNIKFDYTNHTWKNGKCTFCNASEEVYSRDEQLETHAYQFIHTNKPEKIFNMKFDVIIGNPPYQLSDGGGRDSGAISLYHKFIQQAKKLNPRYLSMIVPARWYSGGKGLNDFREEMIEDKSISQLHDFPETSDCFPGLNIRGGVCYFLWEREYNGTCKVFNHKNGEIISESTRYLKEKGIETFIRYNQAISILQKVKKFEETTFGSRVSSRKPFGLDSNFKGFKNKSDKERNIKLYRVGGVGYIKKEQIVKNEHWANKIKVLVSKASPGGDDYPHKIISSPIVALPQSVCTETYLIVGVVETEKQAKNLANYMTTKFFRFLMSLVKNTQNISKGVFEFVPVLDFNKSWDDDELFKKYSITKEDVEFIETIIKPMDKVYE
jgi:site-specific DNA-methyltransferase (adenine-specific)